jgi:glutathione S-transferase
MNRHLSHLRWLPYLVLQAPTLIASARALSRATSHPEVVAALEEFDNRLTYRTFLVGHDIGATDFVLWAALKGEHPVRFAVDCLRYDLSRS